MQRLTLLTIALSFGVAAGCQATVSSGSRPGYAGGPPPPPPSRPAPPDHRPAPPPGPRGPAWDSTGWKLLGQADVNGRVDHDVIPVGKFDGRYDQLTMVVTDSDLQLRNFEIVFGNGNRWSPPNVQHTFREGSRTRVIDLPARDRAIQQINLQYANIPGGGNAHVEIWARDVQGAAQGPQGNMDNKQPPVAQQPIWDNKGWTLLGSGDVQGRGGKVDKDVITVGKNEGRFDQLTMVVADANLDLVNMKVVFGNGNHFEPKLKHSFKEGSRTSVIDLPAKNRVIQKIELEYSNLPGGGKAHVEVWGRDVGAKK